ncbi:hypothetical protein MTR67_049270 [Solanum verrucosum]|uniref:Uncharacterized protein n=1 Tax=Solanum verrucosum TaxID=315347 RepID=A0AAF0UZX7_SOLVR|nr:hypothetical protein MTR67_049270 [Solanum verrucosum]
MFKSREGVYLPSVMNGSISDRRLRQATATTAGRDSQFIYDVRNTLLSPRKACCETKVFPECSQVYTPERSRRQDYLSCHSTCFGNYSNLHDCQGDLQYVSWHWQEAIKC